jgi:hypothetical protein
VDPSTNGHSRSNGNRMKRIVLELTPEELKVLATLVSDQQFRREFIDPKMPGYKLIPAEMSLAKSLASRLRQMVDEANPRKIPQSK